MSKILQQEDLQQINSPELVASLFGKLGYDAHCQPIDVEDLELPPKSADAVIEAYFIANQTDANLQVLLFQLSPQCWTLDSVAVARMSAIANSLCKRPSHFLLLATLDYRQLLLISPQKTLDAQMELKLSIAKTLLSLRDPSFYEIQLLERIAVQSLTSRNLYHFQHQTLSLARQEKSRFKDDPVRDYLQKIGRIKLLTASEEILVSRKIQRLLRLEARRNELKEQLNREPSDKQWAIASNINLSTLYKDIAAGYLARNKLVEANLRLVVSVAKKYKDRGLELLELIQEGNFGLIKASEKFDPTKGYKFSTYAYWWIRQSITRAIHNDSRLIRLPIHCWDKYNKVKKARRLLIQDGKTHPSIPEIAMSLDMTVEDTRNLIQMFQSSLSLDYLVGESEDTRLEEVILSDPIQDNDLEKIALNDYVTRLLSNLNAQEKQVIRLRFDFDGNGEKTLQDIADKLGGLSRERIRQIESKALKKMKKIVTQEDQHQLFSSEIVALSKEDDNKPVRNYCPISSSNNFPIARGLQPLPFPKSPFDKAKKIFDIKTQFLQLNENRKICPQDDVGLKEQVLRVLSARVYKTIAQIVYMIWGVSRFEEPELYYLAEQELQKVFDYQFPLN